MIQAQQYPLAPIKGSIAYDATVDYRTGPLNKRGPHADVV